MLIFLINNLFKNFNFFYITHTQKVTNKKLKL